MSITSYPFVWGSDYRLHLQEWGEPLLTT